VTRFRYTGWVGAELLPDGSGLRELDVALRSGAARVEDPPQREGATVTFAFELDWPDQDVNAAFAAAAELVAGVLRVRGIDPDQQVNLSYEVLGG
jgi:hypothetical protein